MTTQSFSTRIRHDSDAMFREWGLELSTAFAAAGLVQTADTGQIDWTTVTRASTNSDAGYEIWRMNDTPQSTAPVYFRINYGTGFNASAPRIQVIVGTGSNGTGTITGTALSSAQEIGNSFSAQNTDTLRNSYLCVNEGFVGLSWKQASQPEGLFLFCRSCDATGTPDVVGATAIWGAIGNIINQAFRYAATAIAYTAITGAGSTGVCGNWGSVTSTLVGSDFQPELCWSRHPRTYPLFALAGVLNAEVITGNTFTATLVGSTPRTYISLSSFYFISIGSTQVLKPAMLWE